MVRNGDNDALWLALTLTLVSCTKRASPPTSRSSTTAQAATPAAFARSYGIGEQVQARWRGDWYNAVIIGRDATRYRVHYDGYATSWDEWLGPDRLRPQREVGADEQVLSAWPLRASAWSGVVFTGASVMLTGAGVVGRSGENSRGHQRLARFA